MDNLKVKVDSIGGINSQGFGVSIRHGTSSREGYPILFYRIYRGVGVRGGIYGFPKFCKRGKFVVKMELEE